MRAYIDADILIWYFRGERKALNFFRHWREHNEYELWTGAMQRAEVIYFMLPEEEKATMLFLSQLKTAPVDHETVDLGANLYRRWHPTHGVDMNDTMLAASAMRSGGKIFCLNVKHYPMPEVIVEKAW